MNRPHRARYPRRFWVYYAAVLLLAVAGLTVLTPQAGPVPATTLIVVLVFMVLSEATAIALPTGGYVSVGAVFDLACLLILGPIYTAWLNAIATVVTQGVMLRKPWVKVIHNLAIFVLTAFAAGYAFIAAGGTVGKLAFPADIPRLLLCGAVYFLCNSMLVSVVIGLTSGLNPWRIWQRNFLQSILHHLSFVALGSLVAVVYLGAGPWGLVLFGIPFLVARHSFKLYVELKTDLKDFVRALAEVLEEIDPYTRQHSVRVAHYAVQLARGLRLPEREVDEIEYAALVHDLGKIGPHHQHILQKAGSLSHEEQRTLRGHPAAGAEIVATVRALRRAAEIVRTHHERPDGQGYPNGLRSQDVPVGARVLNVSDAFDAMTSDRPYRRALSMDAALRELSRGAGTQFDTDVVACLMRLHRQGEFPLIPSPSSEELLMLRVRGAPRVRDPEPRQVTVR
ncbi:MAG TPA: HD domain-containing phosphohydrolase [Candidatus Limnocylindria bacterium]|nr:HD domain-containing phosphohydrolase [Candidatus Limnocylindria bacterium]